MDTNTPSCSKDVHSDDVFSSSEANTIYLVLGGSPELIKYDRQKSLFKLEKISTETIQLLEDSQAKFQQQVLKKVSMLEI